MSAPLEISLKDKLLFIESLLIPAFNPKNQLDTPEKREEWLETRGVQKKWSLEILTELIERYGTVNSLKKAEKKLEEVKAERLLEKAEENERKLGKSSKVSIFHIHRSSPCLLSFTVYFHLVFLHVVNLCCFLPLLFFAIFLFYRPNSSR